MPRPNDEYLATLTDNTKTYLRELEDEIERLRKERAAAIRLIGQRARICSCVRSPDGKCGFGLDHWYVGQTLEDIVAAEAAGGDDASAR